jgi:sortase A
MNPLAAPAGSASPTRTYILRLACYCFLAFGILALGYAGFVLADSHIYQAVEIRKFERASPSSIARVPALGDVMGEIQVPRLGLDAIVVQGDSAADLRRAIGHIPQTALPGEPGNFALAGHRDTFFRPLRHIRLGDQIRFRTPDQSFDYVVESIQVVAPTDIQVLDPSAGHDLTLVTCFPFYYVGPAPRRFIVRAREMDGELTQRH